MTRSSTIPIVSVIIATYNEPEEVLRQSIQSILDQSLKNIEVLIYDDSTSEESRTMLDSFLTDPRIRIFRSDTRMGFVPSLNRGLKQAIGTYIARMDGDDISLPNRFEIQARFLDNHPHISVVGGSMYIIDENGTIISKRKYPTSNFLLKILSIYRTPLAHPTVMIRRACIEQGFFYDESYAKSEDLEFWLRLIKNGVRIINIPEYLLKYRICGNLSNKRTKEHWNYNLKARKANFSLKDPFWGIFGIMVSFIYTKLPIYIIRNTYKFENKMRRYRKHKPLF